MVVDAGGIAGSVRRELESGLRGEVVGPGDRGYDTARAVFNGMVDRRPLAVIRAVDADDVRRCITFARRHDLPLSVRGGAHGVAGHAVGDGAVMVDLSGMKALRVDPGTRTARAEPGLTLGRVRPRHADVRVGDNARSDVFDGDRRAHARRRAGLAQRQLWPCLRQPDLRRRRDGRRRAAERQRRGERGPVLGDPRRRRQLWGRHLLRVPTSSRRPRTGRRPVVPVEHGAGGPSFLRRLRQGGPGRAVDGRVARAQPGRGAHGVDHRLLLRSDRRRRTGAASAAGIPVAGGRHDPAGAVHGPAERS